MPEGWNERQTTVGEIRARIVRFLRERDWEKEHSPKNLAMSIAIEAGELMEIFQWVDSKDAARMCREAPGVFRHVQEEVADVVIYCLSLANSLGFDLAEAIDHKMDSNALRYPPKHLGDGQARTKGNGAQERG